MEEKETPLDMRMSTSSKGVPRLPLVLRGNVHVTPLYVLVQAGRFVSARAGIIRKGQIPKTSPALAPFAVSKYGGVSMSAFRRAF